jgi:hypothetical protein
MVLVVRSTIRESEGGRLGAERDEGASGSI